MVTKQRSSGVLDATRARLRGTPVHLAWRYVLATVGVRRNAHRLRRTRTYCLFIGHARSGHSVVGALLDAHPNIVISDELDALRYLSAGFDRERVLYLSLKVAADQARHKRVKAGRQGTYSYAVPGQYQGVMRDPIVIGDSRAGWTVQRLASRPRLLDRLRRTMRPLDIRFIHVVRNPFDNISTMMLRGGRTRENAIERYFANCESLRVLRGRIGPDGLLTIRHEDLIAEPRQQLAAACAFLGVEASGAYLDACASVVFSNPSRTREKVEWSTEAIAEVERRIAAFDFLDGYGFGE
jgi:hypothetical protein